MDVEPAACGNEGDGGALPAGEEGREGSDPRRVVRADRLAPQPCEAAVGRRASAAGGATAGAGLRPGGRRGAAGLLRGAGRANGQAGRGGAAGSRGPAQTVRGADDLGRDRGLVGADVGGTIDRKLAQRPGGDDAAGRSLTKPGSLLKDSIPIRTWAQWDDAVPGSAEIDLVGHEGGTAVGEHV